VNPKAKGRKKRGEKEKEINQQVDITELVEEEQISRGEGAEAEEKPELSELEQLKAKLAEKEIEVEENHEKLLRAQADLENYKKRILREKAELFNYRHEELIKELLPILDNLERAIENAKNSQDCSALIEGIELTWKQFINCLEKFGVKSISSLGEKFDPGLQEAMSQIESRDHAPNTVIEEVQKGYLLKDRLLRPSLVVVSRQPEETEVVTGGEEERKDQEKE
jgi:molecular chaperone GrpE